MVELSPEVAAALAENRAVVALESTLIAHGMPYPENIETGRELEATVKRMGGVPATIAIIGGQPKAGLSDAELEALAKKGPEFVKSGARDLAVHIARGNNAATTVSGTMALAQQAGIEVFATGGIGGVHRGNEYDVSSDLFALATTPMAVVSAGAKSILDLSLTLEVLESLSVLVVGYGTDEFPAFYTRSSGLRLEHTVDAGDEGKSELAELIRGRFSLGQGGVLVANPIPSEDERALQGVERELEDHIEALCRQAKAAGISGKALTPYLLSRLATWKQGMALKANKALAFNNAKLATSLAMLLCKGPQSAGASSSNPVASQLS